MLVAAFSLNGNNEVIVTHVYCRKGVGLLTAEIGPIFGRKLKVRFTFFVWSTFDIQVLN